MLECLGTTTDTDVQYIWHQQTVVQEFSNWGVARGGAGEGQWHHHHHRITAGYKMGLGGLATDCPSISGWTLSTDLSPVFFKKRSPPNSSSMITKPEVGRDQLLMHGGALPRGLRDSPTAPLGRWGRQW